MAMATRIEEEKKIHTYPYREATAIGGSLIRDGFSVRIISAKSKRGNIEEWRVLLTKRC